MTPALCTRTSTAAKWATTFSNSVRMLSSSASCSEAVNTSGEPSVRHSSATSSISSRCSKYVSASRLPAAANCSAVSRPMPMLAPVTRTTLPERSMLMTR